MEYVCGGELFSYLRQEGRLPNEHGRFYAAEITCAFESGVLGVSESLGRGGVSAWETVKGLCTVLEGCSVSLSQ